MRQPCERSAKPKAMSPSSGLTPARRLSSPIRSSAFIDRTIQDLDETLTSMVGFTSFKSVQNHLQEVDRETSALLAATLPIVGGLTWGLVTIAHGCTD
jgi:hypothetical protein